MTHGRNTLIQRLQNHLARNLLVRPGTPYMGHTYVQVGVPHGYRTQFDRELMRTGWCPGRRAPDAAVRRR